MPEATRSPAQHLVDGHQGRRPLARPPPGLARPDRRQPARRRGDGDPPAPLRRAVPLRGVHEPASSTSRWCAAGSPRSSPAPGCRPTATPARSCSTSSRPIRATSCSRSAPTSCCRSPLAVLHLQERRQTRLFLRQDPTGRFWSALVYLPRDRYTTEVRLAMQELLLERLGGTSIEYTARSTESVLARLHFVVRVPVGRRGAAEADGGRRRGAAGRARRGRPQLDRRPRRRAARPARRRGRADARPGRRRLPGRLPGGLLRRAGRRRPGRGWTG